MRLSSAYTHKHPPCIGVFDSGLGGLTVVKALQERLPRSPMIYLGDNARVPYGTKSADTVRRYALACARKLMRYDIDLLVVACNTVSALALDALVSELPLPVKGVVCPGAQAAIEASKMAAVGVLATEGTIRSQAYSHAIRALDNGTQIYEQAAPLLVPLVEEGWTEGSLPKQVVHRYLNELLVLARERSNGHPPETSAVSSLSKPSTTQSSTPFDVLILGCTHYPHLSSVFEQCVRERFGTSASGSPRVQIVDSAKATATVVEDCLRKHQSGGKGTLRFLSAPYSEQSVSPLRILITDQPARFETQAKRFLGQRAGEQQEYITFELVDLA